MEEKKTKEASKTILDYNASWPLTVLYLGFLIGIYFAQQFTLINFVTNDMSSYAYYFIAVIAGVIVTFLIYNLGKITFAKVAGYKLLYIKIIGIFIDNSKEKMKISYNITDFFSISMQFTPKDDDTSKDPKMMFFGGLIFEGFLLLAALVFLFTLCINRQSSSISNFGWTFLFATCYGFLTPLYELIPLRQDYPNDMYNVLMTRKEEDRIAFNICQINKKRELTGEDFIIPTFENYDSFYKLHSLYYVYLENLYESKLEKAFSVLEDMKYYAKYYLEDERYLPTAETVYLKFLIDDEPGANKAFLSVKKDERKNVTVPITLAGYRTALLVLANIHSAKEEVLDLLKEFDDLILSYGENKTERVKKEISLFNSAYEKCRKLKPDFELPDRQ